MALTAWPSLDDSDFTFSAVCSPVWQTDSAGGTNSPAVWPLAENSFQWDEEVNWSSRAAQTCLIFDHRLSWLSAAWTSPTRPLTRTETVMCPRQAWKCPRSQLTLFGASASAKREQLLQNKETTLKHIHMMTFSTRTTFVWKFSFLSKQNSP